MNDGIGYHQMGYEVVKLHRRKIIVQTFATNSTPLLFNRILRCKFRLYRTAESLSRSSYISSFPSHEQAVAGLPQCHSEVYHRLFLSIMLFIQNNHLIPRGCGVGAEEVLIPS